MVIRHPPPGYIPCSYVLITEEAKRDQNAVQYSLHDYEEIAMEQMKAISQKA